RYGRLAPPSQKPASISHAALPPLDWDMVRASGLQDAKDLPVALRPRQLDDRDFAARTIRLSRRRSVGHGGVGGPGADGHELGALFMGQDRAGGGVEMPQVAPGAAHCARVLALTVSICRKCACARYSLDLTS